MCAWPIVRCGLWQDQVVTRKVEGTYGMEKPEGPVGAVWVKTLLATDVLAVWAMMPARETRRAETAANADMAKFCFWSAEGRKVDER